MKAVLISIRPEWCEKIASGQKTIEVRKTRPKIGTPFKCYIYKTKQFTKCEGFSFENWISSGKVIGEFICDTIHKYGTRHIYGKYCLPMKIWQKSCLSWEVLDKYADIHDLYCWHISDLLIYDKPKELNDFIRPGSLRGEELDDHICLYCDLGDKRLDNSCEKTKCSEAYIEYLTYENFVIDRPPQSWCYVEELKC